MLYHGFGVHGNTVHFREGFRSAAGVLAHLGDVKAPLDAAVAMVGEGGLDFAAMGPDSELGKLKGPLGPPARSSTSWTGMPCGWESQPILTHT